jgi:hypothetical protein
MLRSPLAFATAATLSLGLSAQSYIALPLDNPTSSTSQNIPLAGGSTSWDEARSHFFVPREFLPPGGSAITAIEFVPNTSNTFSYERFEIWMDHTQNPGLSTTFANNLTNPTLVFNRSPGTISWVGGTWFALTLDTPFFANGQDNLVIEFRKKIDRPNNPTITPSVSQRVLVWPRRTDLPPPVWAYGAYGSGAVDAAAAQTTYSTHLLMRLQLLGSPTITIDSSRHTTGTSTRSYFHLNATMTTTVRGQAGDMAAHILGGAGLSPGLIPIPSFGGGLWLFPTALVVYGSGMIDVAGQHSARLVIPNDPGLIGFRAYIQGVTIGSATAFTNVTDAPIAAY